MIYKVNDSLSQWLISANTGGIDSLIGGWRNSIPIVIVLCKSRIRSFTVGCTQSCRRLRDPVCSLYTQQLSTVWTLDAISRLYVMSSVTACRTFCLVLQIVMMSAHQHERYTSTSPLSRTHVVLLFWFEIGYVVFLTCGYSEVTPCADVIHGTIIVKSGSEGIGFLWMKVSHGPLPYYSVFAADTLLYAVTLTFDLWPWTFAARIVCDVMKLCT